MNDYKIRKVHREQQGKSITSSGWAPEREQIAAAICGTLLICGLFFWSLVLVGLALLGVLQ